MPAATRSPNSTSGGRWAWAQVGDDAQLGAHIFGSLSRLAHHNRQPAQAITYAKQGLERLAAGRRHPGLEARLLALQARGHAAVHDEVLCVTRLRDAERMLTAALDDPPSPWVSAFDEASLAAEAARCFRQVGQLGPARRRAERVVELRPRERARSRALAQLMLTSILVAERKPDEACDIAYEVLDATRALGSYIVVQQLEELDRLFAPYRRNRDVTMFLEVLRDELRERRWLSHWLPPDDADPAGTSRT
jgi:hypothetical protein